MRFIINLGSYQLRSGPPDLADEAYDLAVSGSYRRQGVATRLIQRLKDLVKEYGAWVIFVQADKEDDPTIRLYESMGKKADVLRFDIGI